jgi:bacterioferritin-associated ferredoxin
MIRRLVKRWFGLYDLADILANLTTYANCGLCGKAMRDVVEKDWPWSLCDGH